MSMVLLSETVHSRQVLTANTQVRMTFLQQMEILKSLMTTLTCLSGIFLSVLLYMQDAQTIQKCGAFETATTLL